MSNTQDYLGYMGDRISSAKKRSGIGGAVGAAINTVGGIPMATMNDTLDAAKPALGAFAKPYLEAGSMWADGARAAGSGIAQAVKTGLTGDDTPIGQGTPLAPQPSPPAVSQSPTTPASSVAPTPQTAVVSGASQQSLANVPTRGVVGSPPVAPQTAAGNPQVGPGVNQPAKQPAAATPQPGYGVTRRPIAQPTLTAPTMPVLGMHGGIMQNMANFVNQASGAAQQIAANNTAQGAFKNQLGAIKQADSSAANRAGIAKSNADITDSAARTKAYTEGTNAGIDKTKAEIENMRTQGKSSEIDLANRQRMSALQNEYTTTVDPRRRDEIGRQINILNGKGDKNAWQLHTTFGPPDPITGQPTKSTTAWRTGPDGDIETREVGPGIGAQGAAASVPPAQQRIVGKAYDTPRGKMVWQGNGWSAK